MTKTDAFSIAGIDYSSRLLVGTGKYIDLDETKNAIETSGAQIVTVAIRRLKIGQNEEQQNFLDVISPDKYTILPNTAGCYDVESAVRTCRLARELLNGHELKTLINYSNSCDSNEKDGNSYDTRKELGKKNKNRIIYIIH